MSFLRRLAGSSGLHCLVLVLLALTTLPVAAQHRLVTGAAKSTFEEPQPSPRMMRYRSVALDLPVVANAAADASPYLEIAFFDDAVYTVFLKGSDRTYSGGVAYTGHVATSPLSTVVIVNNAGTVSVTLTGEGRRFSIQGSPERGYVAREHLDSDLPDHAPGVKPPVGGLFEVPGMLRPKSDPTFDPPPGTARDDGSTMDVAVVYTQAARSANGGTSQMHANIDAQITLTNQIYANSSVVQRLRLVYRGEVNYTESSNMGTDLPRVSATSDGFLDDVPVLRDLYQADFVSLWGNYTGGTSCGIGYLMETETATFASSAYNVVSSPGCTGPGSFTFAHELGHNMGLNHDAFEDPNTSTRVTAEGTVTLTTIQYARGYIDLVNRFRTVMAYDSQCNAQVPSFFCTRIPNFSNPSINFNNVAGFAGAFSAPTGVALAHERQALNDTRETTANFRTARATLTGPGILTFLPTSGTVAEGGSSIVLNVGRHVGSTGAVSVTYTTVAGTASAGSDFTATSGTLNWAADDTSNKTIAVPILQDAVLEGTETFTVTLSTPTGGATIAAAGGTATIRITDDEPDTFPVGSALPAGFTTPNVPNANTTDSRWTVDTAIGYLSPASLSSAQAYSPTGTFSVDGTSDLEYTATFAAGNVSFYYKLSGYQNLSGFEFQVDNIAVFTNNAGGEVDWTLVTRAITAGTHTLRWRFKNKLPFGCAGAIPAATGGANCADRAWIDAVSLPPATSGVLLTVIKAGTGAGTVTSSPAGISCGSTCTATFNSGTLVGLTGAVAAGSSFGGWSGGGCGGPGGCILTLNAATTVTVTFNAKLTSTTTLVSVPNPSASGQSVTFTAAVGGSGAAPAGTVTFRDGTTAICSDVAVIGGGAQCATSSLSAGSHSITADYSGDSAYLASSSSTLAQVVQSPGTSFGLTVTKAGVGAGSVTSSPVGISCGSSCAASFNTGTAVTLTATAASGSIFAGWSGGGCSGTGGCTVTMSAAQAVTATFNAMTFTNLILTSSPNPSVAAQSVSFSAMVFSGRMTGTVAFKAGATTLCSSSLSYTVFGALPTLTTAGQAFCSTTALSVGTHSITAEYSGDATFLPSTSSALSQLVQVADPPRLVNIATRMQVLTGDNVLIGGFVIGGSTPKTVVVRARGPSLIPFGVPNALANPTLSLYSGQTVIASNDDHGAAANLAQLQASGFAPSNSLESAILMTLQPGGYTAIVSGVGGGTGVGIVEVFEVDALATPLVNIATRGQVLTGDDVMIGGFIIQGSGPQTVVVRARGPSLVAAGVPNALANPTLSLFSGQTVIASNDNFGTAANAAQLIASGFAPSNALESAILITLNPGAYTAIVSGVGGTTGVGIVEVFTVP